MTYDEYESYLSKMKNANPIIEISKKGILRNSSNGKIGNCHVETFKYTSSSSTDVSKLVHVNETKGDDIIQFSFELRGSLDSPSQTFINNVMYAIDHNVKERDDTCHRYNYINWDAAELEYTIDGFKSAIVASSTGNLPNAVSNGKRISQAIFFMGVHYCFMMDSIAPKYHSAIGKTDIYIPINAQNHVPYGNEVEGRQSCSHSISYC